MPCTSTTCGSPITAPELAKRFVARRYPRKRFHRFTFDAAWQAAVDTLTNPYWRFLGRGSFILRLSGDVEVRLPDGRVYRARLKRHLTEGRPWFVGFLLCQDHAGAARDARLNAEGAVPMEKPPYFDLWPLQVKISPARKPGADYAGLLWVSSPNGEPGGEVYRVVAERRESDVFLNGYVVSYRRTSR